MVVVRNSVRTITSKQSKVDVVPSYTLSTISSPAPGGSISRSKDTTVYSSGSTVTLTAVPANGYRFNGWSGDTTGTTNPLVITMDKNKTMFANFVRQYTLTLTASSPARGTVDPASAVMIDSGATFTIKAARSNGYIFKKWSTTSAGVSIVDTLALTTNVRLAGGNATIQAVFGCVTFAKQLVLSQYPNLNLVDAVQTEDGGYMVVCQVGNEGLLLKLNANGDTTWTKKILYNAFTSIHKASAGYITGSSFGDASYRGIQVNCFSQSGTELWYFMNKNEQGYYFSKVIAKPARNNCYVICGSNYPDLNLIMIDASRTIKWDMLIHNDNKHFGLGDFEQLSDGYIIVGDLGQGFSSYILKTNENGVIQWEFSLKKFFPDDQSLGHTSVCLAHDGSCMISGCRANNTQKRHFLAKLLPNDTSQVTFSYYDNANAIRAVKTVNDGFLVSGSTTILGNGEEDIYIVKTSTTGTIIKESTYGTRDNEYTQSMKITSDGGSIIVGSNNWIIKTDENGVVE